MKRLIQKILWKEYRLSVYYDGETIPRHTFGKNRRLLHLMALHLPEDSTWTIYKKGPFGLGEREVTWGNGKATCARKTRKESV